jgi:threonylcarbamoyladenosine tRNA methylthiotransferase CDKAL1
VVYGCMASAMAEKVRRLAPNAMLVPPEGISSLADLMDRGDPPEDLEGHPNKGSVHVNVPIANGCKGRCTYCITKLARGTLRSRRPEDILEHVRKEIESGRKEIRLTAQDSALYALDLVGEQRISEGAGLPWLMERLTKLEGAFMVRIGMMNPNSLNHIIDPLMDAYEDPKIFNFLHLPIQSGSDTVLHVMDREYSVDEYMDILERFRARCPELYISTDVIAGFPGETHADHKATLDALERIGPGVVNIKAFSARPGTKAKGMPGRVDTKVVKERTRELTRAKRELTTKDLKRFVGRECSVLLTERPKPGTTMGRTRDYRPIAIRGEHAVGRIVDVKVTGTKHSYLVGIKKGR